MVLNFSSQVHSLLCWNCMRNAQGWAVSPSKRPLPKRALHQQAHSLQRNRSCVQQTTNRLPAIVLNCYDDKTIAQGHCSRRLCQLHVHCQRQEPSRTVIATIRLAKGHWSSEFLDSATMRGAYTRPLGRYSPSRVVGSGVQTRLQQKV